MALVLLTMLACLVLSAVVTLYVAYPGRGRAFPGARTPARPASRGTERRPISPRAHVSTPASEGSS